jgi:cardiolipin synthase (CMP-forming)
MIKSSQIMSYSMLPNALSIIRIILTVPVVIALLKEQYLLTLLLFLVAGITDALDGWIAKQFYLQSRLGSILDPVADKILLTCTFITLFWVGVLPLWLLMIIFVRDVIIIAGALGYFLGEESADSDLLEPSLISKVNTVLQITLVLYLLLIELHIGIDGLKEMVFIIVATSTALSGADYGLLWVKKFILQETKK